MSAVERARQHDEAAAARARSSRTASATSTSRATAGSTYGSCATTRMPKPWHRRRPPARSSRVRRCRACSPASENALELGPVAARAPRRRPGGGRARAAARRRAPSLRPRRRRRPACSARRCPARPPPRGRRSPSRSPTGSVRRRSVAARSTSADSGSSPAIMPTTPGSSSLELGLGELLTGELGGHRLVARGPRAERACCGSSTCICLQVISTRPLTRALASRRPPQRGGSRTPRRCPAPPRAGPRPAAAGRRSGCPRVASSSGVNR